MFYLPEIFINYNNLNLGICQNHIPVNDAVLPNWSKSDPRLFVKMNKKAMESTKVSRKINEWIDLIFGFKQTGNEAINALNVFKYFSYEGNVDFQKLSNQERDDALLEVMEFGQIPIQVMNKVHEGKNCHEKCLDFFSRPAYLINFQAKEKEYTITLATK